MTARPPSAVPAVDPAIVSDIRRASRLANVDFGYLMAQASQESSFQPDAKAATSSATGLYQFIDSTWLTAVKNYGAKYGLGNYASQIQVSDSGAPHVADPSVKQQILDLRKDPKVASEIAAEFAHQNKADVERALGRPASSTDLYLAHFLGAQGATSVVKSIEHDGKTKAADLLPQAAAANKSVFYDSATGEAKTVAQIYQSFAAKIERQINQYSSATGDTGEGAVDAAVFKTPLDLPTKLNQPMLAMMNVIALAAMKLVGETETKDTLSPGQTVEDPKHKPTDTSA
ncbi:MAG TPA: transglycosylase SLT domain-containing protein [Aliidongia sp.]|nr:transglycosylase SLT domain-containing protein [Aliidongia sp.]